jgi:hypothetical protein
MLGCPTEAMATESRYHPDKPKRPGYTGVSNSSVIPTSREFVMRAADATLCHPLCLFLSKEQVRAVLPHQFEVNSVCV